MFLKNINYKRLNSNLCNIIKLNIERTKTMNNKILEAEKSLFKYEFMSDITYLNEIIDDEYIEIGKSGKKFNKKDVIKDLSILKKDRKIIIYNFTCDKIEENIYLIHYITQSNNDNIYRTSIWKKEDDIIKIIFHQASLYKENINLIEY